jgi:hypothetical protein
MNLSQILLAWRDGCTLDFVLLSARARFDLTTGSMSSLSESSVGRFPSSDAMRSCSSLEASLLIRSDDAAGSSRARCGDSETLRGVGGRVFRGDMGRLTGLNELMRGDCPGSLSGDGLDEDAIRVLIISSRSSASELASLGCRLSETSGMTTSLLSAPEDALSSWVVNGGNELAWGSTRRPTGAPKGSK